VLWLLPPPLHLPPALSPHSRFPLFFAPFPFSHLLFSDPFGYDKNDLNLDHFTHNIIRNELRAITSSAPPLPDRWVSVCVLFVGKGLV
jgi:hypothetical protein